MQIPTPIRSELAPGEQVIWSGQPRQGVILRASDIFTIPFSLLWASIAVFWFYTAISQGAPLAFSLFGVPFVLIGVYIVLGRFLTEAKQRQHTYYALTAQRIIIISGVFSTKVQSINLKIITELSLSERANGYGSITFAPQSPSLAFMVNAPSWSGMPALSSRFDFIPQARAVYASIRKLQTA